MLPEMNICPCLFSRTGKDQCSSFNALKSHILNKYLGFWLAGDLFLICPDADVEEGNCIYNGVPTH